MSTQKIFREVLSAALLLAAFVLLCVRYTALPEMIHSPFNGGGDAHGIGPKVQLWAFLVIAAWVYVLMSLINVVPASVGVNAPASTTPEERERIMQRVQAGMGWFKVVMMGGLLMWMFRLTAYTAR